MPKDVTRETVAEIKGMRQLLKVLSKLPKDLQGEVRDASQAIADQMASGARSAAHTPLQRAASSALKSKRDRVPVVSSGKGIVTSQGATAGEIFFGAEFGGGKRPTTRQFLPHRGREGYFFYPYARAHGRQFATMWAEAVDKAFKDWDYRPR